MSTHRRLRHLEDPADTASDCPQEDATERRRPTVLEALHRTVPTRSIQSSHVASEDSAEAPIRAAWIIA
jgi:hypothetical protein